MAHRGLIRGAVFLLFAAACSSDDRPSSDAGTAEGGTNSRDVARPDDVEGGIDPHDVAPDGSLPDEGGKGEGGTDGRTGPDGMVDGEGGGYDADAAPDRDGNPLDSDANPEDGDGGQLDGEGGSVDGDAPPLSCGRTQERLSFTVTIPGGGIHDCAHTPTDGGFPRTLHTTFSGVVVASSTDGGTSSTLRVDACTSDVCGAEFYDIKLASPTSFTLPVGAFVEAEYWFEQSFSCTELLRISNLPEWNGKRNPISEARKTYVVASDGLVNPTSRIAPTGVTVSTKRLGCPAPDVSCGGPLPNDDYAFEFSASGSSPLTVPMGQSIPWSVGGQNVVVRNHRSYQSELCDDYWNWAFTIVGQ